MIPEPRKPKGMKMLNWAILQAKQKRKRELAKLRFPNDPVDTSKEWKLGDYILPVKTVPRPKL